MIKTFRHKGLKELFDRGRTGRVDSKQHKRCREVLSALDAATSVNQMFLPGWNTHALKQYDPVRYSVWISAQWRITFEFKDGGAYRVDLEQYH